MRDVFEHILLYILTYKLTVLVHRRLKTLVEPAGPALVSVGFVNGAPAFEFALCLARVYSVPVDAPFEKPGTACRIIITRHNDVYVNLQLENI